MRAIHLVITEGTISYSRLGIPSGKYVNSEVQDSPLIEADEVDWQVRHKQRSAPAQASPATRFKIGAQRKRFVREI